MNEPQKPNVVRAFPTPKRDRDPVWDALEDLFGPVPTPSARSLRNAAVKELRAAGATPGEIGVAYYWCKENFTTFTEMALAKYYGRAQHELAQQAERKTSLSEVRKMADDS